MGRERTMVFSFGVGSGSSTTCASGVGVGAGVGESVAVGVAAGVALAGDTHEAGAKKFIRAIRALNERMGLPKTLAGIREEDIPQMARYAAREANPLYPVPKLMDAGELQQFYKTVSGRRE